MSHRLWWCLESAGICHPVSPIIWGHLKIVHLEMLNVVLALRLWARDWAHSAMKFLCDNLSVVQVVQTSKTRDNFLTASMRNIWLILAMYDTDFHIDHVAGSKNEVADTYILRQAN